MDVYGRIAASGVLPVTVLDDAGKAVSTAEAMAAGGIDVMEITFRTPAAADAIRAVAQDCPDVLVGAGTVMTLEQCQKAVGSGAAFIVSPGYDQAVVGWCLDHGVAVIPGCVTPTEITGALKMGLHVLKFFPANVYGGLDAMKSLSAPFGEVKFIPTGGVDAGNVGAYARAPFVHAVGGSWVCPRADIAAGHFEKITALCREARSHLLGFAVAHVGINCQDPEEAAAVCGLLGGAFQFPVREGAASNFSSEGIEVLKSRFRGANGHIAVQTNAMDCAIEALRRRRFTVDMSTARYQDGRLMTVYLAEEIGGFAIHLLQK